MDNGLKQRLIGALVLLAVGVIFLPVLFEPDHRRTLDRTSQIPPALTLKSIQVAEPIRNAEIESVKPAAEMYVLKEERPAQSVAPIADSSGSPNRAILDSKGVVKAWFVQVVSYETVERANRLKDQLLAEGYPAMVRSVTTSKGVKHRVYVGPNLDHKEAEKIKQKLDSSLKVKAIVLSFTP